MVGQWESVSRFSIQASIVEEGIHVTDSGRGELNAAIEGLDLLVQVLMPPVVGRMYAEFLSPTVLPKALQWGGGGTFWIGGILCLASALMLIATPPAAPRERQKSAD